MASKIVRKDLGLWGILYCRGKSGAIITTFKEFMKEASFGLWDIEELIGKKLDWLCDIANSRR